MQVLHCMSHSKVLKHANFAFRYKSFATFQPPKQAHQIISQQLCSSSLPSNRVPPFRGEMGENV